MRSKFDIYHTYHIGDSLSCSDFQEPQKPTSPTRVPRFKTECFAISTMAFPIISIFGITLHREELIGLGWASLWHHQKAAPGAAFHDGN